MKISTTMLALAAPLAILPLSACSEDSPANNTNTSSDGSFIISASVQGSNATTNVLISAQNLDEGSISAIGNGLINDGATHWLGHSDKYLYALTYNQGNAGATRSYSLNPNGKITPRDIEYKVSRFNNFGSYNNLIITTSTGDGPSQFADANGYLPKTLLVNYLDVDAETSLQNNTASGAYSMENLLGNGEWVTLAGIQQRENQIISGAIPMGLSQFGAAAENGKWIRPGFEDLVKTADGGSNSSAYKKGELQWTQYPNECWVAIFKDKDLQKPTLIRSDKISYPAGRYKSRYYQTILTNTAGDTYVFSPSYAKSMSDPRQQTSLPAGVIRIPRGSDNFDDFYANIEALSGGKSFLRVWNAGGNRFLLAMYDRPLSQSGFAATELAIFDADSKKLTYVNGLPNDITAFSDCNPLVRNGKVYIPIMTESAYPAVYVINPANATAAKGISVEASSITGLAFLKP